MAVSWFALAQYYDVPQFAEMAVQHMMDSLESHVQILKARGDAKNALQIFIHHLYQESVAKLGGKFHQKLYPVFTKAMSVLHKNGVDIEALRSIANENQELSDYLTRVFIEEGHY